MKKVSAKKRDDDLRPEYDLSKLKGGVRGKYYRQAAAGTNLMLIEPDLVEVFGDAESVNRALRLLVDTAEAVAEAARRRDGTPSKRPRRARRDTTRAAEQPSLPNKHATNHRPESSVGRCIRRSHRAKPIRQLPTGGFPSKPFRDISKAEAFPADSFRSVQNFDSDDAVAFREMRTTSASTRLLTTWSGGNVSMAMYQEIRLFVKVTFTPPPRDDRGMRRPSPVMIMRPLYEPTRDHGAAPVGQCRAVSRVRCAYPLVRLSDPRSQAWFTHKPAVQTKGSSETTDRDDISAAVIELLVC